MKRNQRPCHWVNRFLFFGWHGKYFNRNFQFVIFLKKVGVEILISASEIQAKNKSA